MVLQFSKLIQLGIRIKLLRKVCYATFLTSILLFINCSGQGKKFYLLQGTGPQKTAQPAALLPCRMDQHLYRLNADKAVAYAQCFILVNGYTKYPPTVPLSLLAQESWGDNLPPEQRAMRRYNSLENHAAGIRAIHDTFNPGKFNQQPSGWQVAFRYRADFAYLCRLVSDCDQWRKDNVRVVSLNAFGGELKVEHEDFKLADFQRLDELGPDQSRASNSTKHKQNIGQVGSQSASRKR